MRTLLLTTIICFAFLQNSFSQTEVWRTYERYNWIKIDGIGNVYLANLGEGIDTIKKLDPSGSMVWRITDSVKKLYYNGRGFFIVRSDSLIYFDTAAVKKWAIIVPLDTAYYYAPDLNGNLFIVGKVLFQERLLKVTETGGVGFQTAIPTFEEEHYEKENDNGGKIIDESIDGTSQILYLKANRVAIIKNSHYLNATWKISDNGASANEINRLYLNLIVLDANTGNFISKKKRILFTDEQIEKLQASLSGEKDILQTKELNEETLFYCQQADKLVNFACLRFQSFLDTRVGRPDPIYKSKTQKTEMPYIATIDNKNKTKSVIIKPQKAGSVIYKATGYEYYETYYTPRFKSYILSDSIYAYLVVYGLGGKSLNNSSNSYWYHQVIKYNLSTNKIWWRSRELKSAVRWIQNDNQGRTFVKLNNNIFVYSADGASIDSLSMIQFQGNYRSLSESFIENGYVYLTKDGYLAKYSLPNFKLISNVELQNLSDRFSLSQNYPNPFNPTTTISFELPKISVVNLKIYNVIGQEVATLISNEEMESGKQEVEWDASTFSSGVYFYKLTTPTFSQTRKLLLMK
ncbi:MAG: T9SS type A sorting domain-containing protein [Ignavibacteria bacterium]|nr:T9SS type A sorting domain-containing protein [Ignavibacteria bacterium]